MRGSQVRVAAAASIGLAATILMAALSAPIPAAAQSPSPTADGALAAVELMNLAPVGIRESCLPAPGGGELQGIVASAQCLHEGSVVIYARFEDGGSLEAAYDALASLTGLAADTGTACRDGAFEGGYPSPSGAPAGRLVCQLGPDGHMAIWTDTERSVLGFVQAVSDTSFEALEAAWLAARLDADATSTDPQPPAEGSLAQWAIGATASSQFGSDSWGAIQATGPPDTMAYGDLPTAWAPATSDGVTEFLELTFETAVIPTKVVIWETSGNGFVRSIEADDPASGYFVLWQGVDDSPPQVHGFSPPLAPTDVAIDRLRISVDTTVPDWNEIDAVELTGILPDTP
jgi:hypothetical protein